MRIKNTLFFLSVYVLLLCYSLRVSAQNGTFINLNDYRTSELNDTLNILISENLKFGIATKDGKLLIPVEYDDLSKAVYTDNSYGKELFFLLSKDNKWGIASNKRVYVEPQYDDLLYSAGKMLSYEKDGKIGVVTLKGRDILHPEYDIVKFYSNSWFSPCDFIAACKNGQWSITGYHNLNQVDVAFDDVDASDDSECRVTIGGGDYALTSAFFGGYANLSQNELYGMVDPQGNIVVPVEFDKVSDIGRDIFVVEKNELYGLYRNGKPLAQPIYNMFMGFREDSLCLIMYKDDCAYEIDLSGKASRQPSVSDLKSKYDPWVIDCDNGQAIVYVAGHPCVMSYDETIIIPPQYRQIDPANSMSLFGGFGLGEKIYYKVGNDHGKRAAFDEKGKQLTDFIYDDLRYVGGNKEAFAVGVVEGDVVRCGICDSTGREIIPLEYDHFGKAKGDLFAMKKNGKYGIVNTDNKIVYPFEIDSVVTYFSLNKNSHLLAFTKGGKWALMDDKGNQITDFVFDYEDNDLIAQSVTLSEDYAEDMGVVMNEDCKYGFLDRKGQLTIPCVYEYANSFTCGLAAVENTERQYGYIDKKGNIVIPFIYDFATEFDPVTKTAKVRLNDNSVYIDLKGNVVKDQ